MSDTSAATPSPPSDLPPKTKDEEYKISAMPAVRQCTQEEYEQVVKSLTSDLKPYQIDLWNTLKAFHADESQQSLDFPATLTNNERLTVHQLADIFGMAHESSGRGQKRFIRCEKKKTPKSDTPSFEEMYFFKGYIGLMGPCVDSYANQAKGHIPSEYIEPRVKRDGPKHHITILTKKELKALSSKGEDEDFDDNTVIKLLTKLSEEVKNDWQDMGLGRVSAEANGEINEAFYKIVHWDAANKFRKELGLPEKQYALLRICQHVSNFYFIFFLFSFVLLPFAAFISQ
eukprot:Phypoly_transcript_13606.p1 GENE.Phypoly_transcript_13606~~Phypoly_transcript_13606.p1  ORF type:complete len:305 (+),score=44.39 Phypoly_transcript_13606:57-917(+)